MGRPRRTMEDWLATRQAMLRAAAEVLAERGIEGLTIDAVAARARVAKGTVQYNLGSKEQMLHDLGRWLLRTNYGAGMGREEMSELDEISHALVRGLAGDPVRLRAILSLISSAPRLEFARELLEAHNDRLDEHILPILEREGVPDRHVALASRMIRGLVLGVCAHWLVKPLDRDFDDLAAEVAAGSAAIVVGFRAGAGIRA